MENQETVEDLSKPARTKRKQFATELSRLSDDDITKRTSVILWKVATIAAQNAKNDAHWQKLSCKMEAQRRGKPEL